MKKEEVKDIESLVLHCVESEFNNIVTRPIKSKEDAARYVKFVKHQLFLLAKESTRTGLLQQASMFIGMHSIFSQSTDAINRLAKVVELQIITEMHMAGVDPTKYGFTE